MKKYLLDTNICIFFLQGKYSIVDKIKEVGQKNCLISEITVAELYFGAYHSNNKEKHLKETKAFISQFTILPIFNCLETYAAQKAEMARKGELIDDFDTLIGAAAICNKIIMVTDNVRHLSHLNGIVIENWIKR
jgi:tRNA(fMet)-specific endonuclease VapC